MRGDPLVLHRFYESILGSIDLSEGCGFAFYIMAELVKEHGRG
jgi:hypothetical protein